MGRRNRRLTGGGNFRFADGAGQRDLEVLAKQFVKHVGQVNIRRHDTPADLYQARVNSVIEKLREAGVETQRMRISDGMPGGSGIASEKILIILEAAYEGAPTATSTTYESGPR